MSVFFGLVGLACLAAGGYVWGGIFILLGFAFYFSKKYVQGVVEKDDDLRELLGGSAPPE